MKKSLKAFRDFKSQLSYNEMRTVTGGTTEASCQQPEANCPGDTTNRPSDFEDPKPGNAQKPPTLRNDVEE